ncbi:hypothetical protein QJS10_CPA02g01349 [Acorus calamus]|uniref:Uncharacterized protein n=1 Tax=Acorus calamus TaxID=4465 RepID=A0AAV9FAZ2_ACOCL|nr:hypothetical protein QJS10_CPA02g01349 [Acorus calamus]
MRMNSNDQAALWPKDLFNIYTEASRHTIILMQTSPNRASRTFMDYESISQAMDEQFIFAAVRELSPKVSILSSKFFLLRFFYHTRSSHTANNLNIV